MPERMRFFMGPRAYFGGGLPAGELRPRGARADDALEGPVSRLQRGGAGGGAVRAPRGPSVFRVGAAEDPADEAAGRAGAGGAADQSEGRLRGVAGARQGA